MTVIGVIAIAAAIAGSTGRDTVRYVAHATDPFADLSRTPTRSCKECFTWRATASTLAASASTAR